MSNCVFCDVVAAVLPSSIVYEDDFVLAILDTSPVNSGHVLVLPKQHIAGLAGLDEATGMHLFRVAMRAAQAIRGSGVRCEGVNLFLADGEAAFQEVFHAHMHVIPRFKGDAFKIDADWSVKPSREELDEIAARIRDAFVPESTDSKAAGSRKLI